MSLEITIMPLDFDSASSSSNKNFEKSELTIGSSDDCDVILKDENIAEEHAVIKINQIDGQNVVQIIDLGSSSGTMIDNIRLTPYVATTINRTQRIIIGSYLLKPKFLSCSSSQDNKASNGSLASKIEVTREDSNIKNIEITNGGRIIPKYIDSDADKIIDQYSEASMMSEIKLNGIVDSDIIELDFVATMLVDIKGQVLHKGLPLAGVKVNAGALGCTHTDEYGNFEFANLYEGTQYEISLSLDGYKFEGTCYQGTANQNQQLSFNAIKLCQLKGRIIHQGKPLAGVKVSAGNLGQVSTDDNGVYHFKDIPEGSSYELSIIKPGFVFKVAG